MLWTIYCKCEIHAWCSEHAGVDKGELHIHTDVKDIEKVYAMINRAGLNSTQDTVHFLPFWENGVKFFTIEEPIKKK